MGKPMLDEFPAGNVQLVQDVICGVGAHRDWDGRRQRRRL